jgi:hypothetical protein
MEPRVLLEKLTVTQLVKKSPSFYGTSKFITVFIRAHQCVSLVNHIGLCITGETKIHMTSDRWQ